MSHPYDFGKIATFGADRDHKKMVGQRVRIEEKIDGSQFSFWYDVPTSSVVCCSRSRVIPRDAEGQFAMACATVRSLSDQLATGMIYRGEAVTKERHNVIAYERVPKGGIVLWGLELMHGPERVLPYGVLETEAERLGLEVTPLIAEVELHAIGDISKYIEGPSLLGGQREGVVLKSGELRAKIVGERFAEKSKSRVKKPKLTEADQLHALGRAYAPVPRWEKAVGRLRDAGELTGTPADIGKLVKAVQSDILEEEAEAIKEQLMGCFWGTVAKGAVDGLALWYKAKLAEEV